MERIEADFVVIGAGFAGLHAAAMLREARRSVVVLEASERVGGRAHTSTLEGVGPVDLGAHWVLASHERMHKLARAHGVEVTPAYTFGPSLLVSTRGARRFRGAFPALDPFSFGALRFVLARLDALARTVPPEAPWSAPDAKSLDAQTLETFLRSALPAPRARALLSAVFSAAFCCEPGDLSLLHALVAARSAGGVHALCFAQLGGERQRLQRGAQTLAERVASSLGGDAVRTGAAVRALEQREDRVYARTERHEVCAKRALVAMPPALAARIAYLPSLPAAREQLTQRVPQGSVICCAAEYASPFWREQGLSGHALCEDGPVQVAHDVSPQDGSAGVLQGVSAGAEARSLARLAPAERRARVLDVFARAFGEAARTPRTYVEKCWADDASLRGGTAGFFPPGVWTAHGSDLRAPVGRIHWASAESATRWVGHLEGSLEAGERAARELLRACPA